MADINTATFPSLYAGTKRPQDYDNDYLYYDSCLLHPRQGHQGTDGENMQLWTGERNSICNTILKTTNI